MIRSRSLKTPRSFWFVAALLWRMAFESVRGAEVPSRPNVLLILADDLGYDGLGCYGNTHFKTPTLDRLAAEGMRFNHCYSAPLCKPSRTQLLTGRYNHRNFVGRGHLPPGSATIASVLKASGYATCLASKWHLQTDNGALPGGSGFDEWYWSLLFANYYDPVIDINGNEKTFKGGYGPDIRMDLTLDFIERHKDQPWFVYAAMHLPHAPEHSPPGANLPATATKSEQYAAMLAYQDTLIGKLVAKLDTLKIRDNTLIIFLGDNGTPKYVSYPFQGETRKGGKGSLTDGGTHVPMIVNWPARLKPGQVSDALVDFSDFLPTLAAACGADAPRNVDGRSFLPLLTGDAYTPREWAFLYGCENSGASRSYWARDQRWKLYRANRLFDLKADPAEAHELPPEADTPEQAAARKRLQRAIDELGAEAVRKADTGTRRRGAPARPAGKRTSESRNEDE